MKASRPIQDIKSKTIEPHQLKERSRIDIIIEDRRWYAAVPSLKRRVQRAVLMTSQSLQRPYYPNILLTDDRTVKAMNALFRGRNKPTNVLTFEGFDACGDGDIAMAYETIHREACTGGRTFSAHMLHLLVHGLLHLAGHDHLQAGEARRMEQAETRVLSRLGVANPWRVGGRIWR